MTRLAILMRQDRALILKAPEPAATLAHEEVQVNYLNLIAEYGRCRFTQFSGEILSATNAEYYKSNLSLSHSNLQRNKL
jgi:hypothetical protein